MASMCQSTRRRWCRPATPSSPLEWLGVEVPKPECDRAGDLVRVVGNVANHEPASASTDASSVANAIAGR